MLWLHRTALFQTARRMERKPGLRGKSLPLASEMGEGTSGGFKTEPNRGGRATLSCVFPKGSDPKGRNLESSSPRGQN